MFHDPNLYNHAAGKPNIRFYEGLDGIPGLDEIDRYFRARLEKKIFMRVIRSRSRDTKDIWPITDAELREVRLTPPALTLAMTTLIYGNTAALISSKRENYGLIIESEEYAAHQGMLFEAVWMASEPT
ncbi:Uncharacterised protein [Oligella ureolytica]|uniref:hypothetical protein n=1 Tax=Oligella ureolytica TaxID=90244 RepID=UPI000E00A32C|nr:hypothetical protein [Oligella ureolytica]SUA59143.1 Uncharacterised protein [Oligella ureolytica]